MAPRQLRGRGKSFAVVLFRTIVIGSVLCRPVLAGAFSDAPVATSIKISETSVMNEKKPSPAHRSVQTASGRISYTEHGSGPVAAFGHDGSSRLGLEPRSKRSSSLSVPDMS